MNHTHLNLTMSPSQNHNTIFMKGGELIMESIKIEEDEANIMFSGNENVLIDGQKVNSGKEISMGKFSPNHNTLIINGGEIIIRLIKIKGHQAYLSFSAPRGVEIDRKKIYERKYSINN